MTLGETAMHARRETAPERARETVRETAREMARERVRAASRGCGQARTVQIEHSESNHGVNAVILQLERALERGLRELRLAQLLVAVSQAQAHGRRRAGVDLEDLAIEFEGLAEAAHSELCAGLAEERRDRGAVEGFDLGERLLRTAELALCQL